MNRKRDEVEVEITPELRRSLNEWLSHHYGTRVPSDKEYVYDDGEEYTLMDSERSQIFYIPKNELK